MVKKGLFPLVNPALQVLSGEIAKFEQGRLRRAGWGKIGEYKQYLAVGLNHYRREK